MSKAFLSARASLLVALFVFAAACAPAAPSPTAAPAKPAEKAVPTAAPAKAAEKPAAKAQFDEKAVADFYKGKTVTILVGHAAGGGFDTYARAIARHISKHIPGNPTVIVENMPGAGTMLALNHTYNTGSKDGTLILSFDGGLAAQQLFGAQGVEFDMTKLHYLGAPSAFQYIMAVNKSAGIEKFQDILGPNAKEVVIGANPNTKIEHSALLIRDVLGAKAKVVTGYQGTAPIRLAMEKGEVDSTITDWGSLRVSNLADMENGNWVILAQLTEAPIEELPQKNVPLISEFAKGEQLQLFKLAVIEPNQYSRPYAVAPEVPADRVAALQAAFTKVLADPELLAEVEKAKLDISPISAARLKEMIVEGLSVPADVREKLRAVLAPNS